MPKLGPFVGALKIHKILISSDRLVKKKNMPSDLFYQNVRVKESRKPRRRESDTTEEEPVNDLEDIELGELDEDDN